MTEHLGTGTLCRAAGEAPALNTWAQLVPYRAGRVPVLMCVAVGSEQLQNKHKLPNFNGKI